MSNSFDLADLPGMGDKLPKGKHLFPMQGDEPFMPERIIADFRFQKAPTKLLLYALNQGRASALVGPTGAGKTSHAIQLFERLNKPYVVVSCHSDFEASDLFGYERVRANPDGRAETVYIDGPVIRAMREGIAVILEERDSLPPTVNLALNNVLDGLGYEIPETGEHVSPAKGFVMIATANTAGAGDEAGRYVTSHIASASSNNRWLVALVDYMAEEDEIEVLVGKASKNAFREGLEGLVKFANATRAAAASGEMEAPATTRELIQTVELSSFFLHLDEAAEMAYFNKLSSVDRVSAQKQWSLLFSTGDESDADTPDGDS
ncbi:MAG: MoxR family ATPase [Salinisphaeraceae bacterium]